MSVQFYFPDRDIIFSDSSETARYLGYRKFDVTEPEVLRLIEECQEEMHKIITPKAVFSDFDLEITSLTSEEENITSEIRFADVCMESRDLGRNLVGCSRLFLFAATIGSQVDALIRRTQSVDSVRAAVMQACGAMYAENFVEQVNKKIKDEALSLGFRTRPRYSPGYGDVPLTVQKDFFRLLPLSKIGLTLMDTLIMAPEKSVTAFVGLYK